MYFLLVGFALGTGAFLTSLFSQQAHVCPGEVSSCWRFGHIFVRCRNDGSATTGPPGLLQVPGCDRTRLRHFRSISVTTALVVLVVCVFVSSRAVLQFVGVGVVETCCFCFLYWEIALRILCVLSPGSVSWVCCARLSSKNAYGSMAPYSGPQKSLVDGISGRQKSLVDESLGRPKISCRHHPRCLHFVFKMVENQGNILRGVGDTIFFLQFRIGHPQKIRCRNPPPVRRSGAKIFCPAGKGKGREREEPERTQTKRRDRGLPHA